jgi:hypothetical protein
MDNKSMYFLLVAIANGLVELSNENKNADALMIKAIAEAEARAELAHVEARTQAKVIGRVEARVESLEKAVAKLRTEMYVVNAILDVIDRSHGPSTV